jgi:response regulator of citrate/malate metabolism
MPKVLIVEDDVLIADSAKQFVVKCGYEVCGIAGASATGVETPGGQIAATRALSG